MKTAMRLARQYPAISVWSVSTVIVVDGDLMVQGVGGGFIVIETAASTDTRTRQYNSDAAVVTGKWKAKGNVQGQPFDSTVTFSVMCIRQRNSWKIVTAQFTPALQ
ncbi:DUF4440 domain-containing protein [Spirosoma luteum]|uniref:DUF4440 domain-containing protein n=1 Tax=Spirosoma luteum TaxID=431553 RepID=UPI001FDEA880|nr:DUF4440 domain-containing protein [Spirosoma luteum]